MVEWGSLALAPAPHPSTLLSPVVGAPKRIPMPQAGAQVLWGVPRDTTSPPQNDEVDILGLDGHIYKGRMDMRKLPNIPSKEPEGSLGEEFPSPDQVPETLLLSLLCGHISPS